MQAGVAPLLLALINHHKPSLPVHLDALSSLEALLDAGAEVDAPCADGVTTALDLAIACGHADVAAVLVERGASVPRGAEPLSCPPLLCAAVSGDVECVRVLASTAAKEGIYEVAAVAGWVHGDDALSDEEPSAMVA